MMATLPTAAQCSGLLTSLANTGPRTVAELKADTHWGMATVWMVLAKLEADHKVSRIVIAGESLWWVGSSYYGD